MTPYTSPDFSSAALITIDTQRDTLDGQRFEIPGTSAVLPMMRGLLEAFRKTGRLIVHVVRIYLPDGSNVDLCRRESVEEGRGALLADSTGCQLAAELLPEPGTKLDTRCCSPGICRRSAVTINSNGAWNLFRPRGVLQRTGLCDKTG